MSLLVACLVALAAGRVYTPASHNEVLHYANMWMQDHHTYGVYFTDQEEGFFASVANFFAPDKEAEFKKMLLDTEQISLLRLNVLENPEFAHMQ